MLKQLLLPVLLAVLLPGFVLAQEPVPAENASPTVDFLLASLASRDESIRREAFRRLVREESIDALPRLTEAIRSADEETAVRATLAFVARLGYLRLDTTTPDPQEPLVLTDEDKQQLAAVAGMLSAGDVEHWRWYLAEWVLEQVAPGSLNEQRQALVAAVRGAQPMRQFAAVRGLLLVDPANGDEVKPALLAALRQPDRPKFVGIYLRNDRTIENNRVAFTADVWSAPANSTQYEFYADDQFLILAALLRFGASFDEVGPELVALSRHEREPVRLQAAEQLTQLGAPGLKAADAALAPLLADRSSPLVRQLADEDRPTREYAISIFSRLGAHAHDVVMPLAALLDSSEDRLRQSAALALGNCGPSAQPAAAALRRAIEAERLLVEGVVLDASFGPEALLRARERYQDMQAALALIEAPAEEPATP
jgi:HEAT repeat protein